MSWLRTMMRPTALVKASATQTQPQRPPKRWTFDPETSEYLYQAEVPTHQHPGTLGLSYQTLFSLSRIPVIGAVIQTRVNQVADFARPQPDPYSIGYRIRHRDLKREMTTRDANKIKVITEIIERAGGPYWYGGFEGFLRAIVRDSLTYDQANFEVIRERGGLPWGFVPVDPQTIRRAKPSDKAMERGAVDPDEIGFLQIMNNRIVNEWKRGEMAFCVRRPRSWVYANGYGYPELEELLTTITNILNAETFNAVNFTNGIHARTILGLKSTMDETMFKAFKREIVAMMSGVANSRRMPIVQLDPEFKEELAAIPLDRSNREMEYREWLNWLLKVLCGGFQMDPAELGFVFGNEGQSAGLQGSSVGERIALSKEKGLRPLLRAIAYWLNEWVIQPINEDYMLDFVGFDEETEKDRNELDVQAVSNWLTVDEIRAQKDLEPLPDGQGEIILNPTWLQAKQATDMQNEEGEEGDELYGDDEDFDDDFGGDGGGDEEYADADALGGGNAGDEDMAASQGQDYGQIDAVWELSGQLQQEYTKRLKQLTRLIKKADQWG